MTDTTHTFDPAKAEAFAGRLMPLLAGGIQSQLIDLGDRTGLFAAAAEGPATSDELADRADLVERYVREWLGAMVTAGIMHYNPANATYLLPPEHAALLVGPASMTPMARANTVLSRHVPELARVFREGGGIPYAEYTPDFSDAMDGMSRGGYDQFLLSQYLPMAPGLADRLTAGARAADVACGSGHALVVLARAFPQSVFTGYDTDEHALGRARKEAADEGLTNLTFELTDIRHLDGSQRFDAIFMFDALHDQVDPAGVLQRVSACLAPGGVFLLREPHAADRLEDNVGNPMAAVQYSVSVMHCLTVSLAHAGAGIGLAFGEGHARRLLTEAGFADPQLHPAPGQPFDVVYVTRRAAP
jgi:SAM-dependent methyltransferase